MQQEREDQQQTAPSVAANSQPPISIEAMSRRSGGVARIETGLRSMAEQLSQIEEGISNLHTVSYSYICSSAYELHKCG